MSLIRSTLAAVQSGRLRTPLAAALRYLLVPLSLIYRTVVALRSLLYKGGVLRAKRCSGKIISIGNITTGGTGKTPVTLMLANWLKSRNLPFAVLSRGYQSPSEKGSIVFNSSASVSNNVVGDEIALLSRKLLDTWFGVGRDRMHNIRILEQRQDVGIFLLDDGFQHRQLFRDYDIVLLDASNPFGNGWLLPAGNQREPLSSLARADIVLIARVESSTPAKLAVLKERLLRYVDEKRIFEIRTTIARSYDLATGEPVELSELLQRKCAAFCGIGNPDSFTQLLAANGITVNQSIVFDDHHCYLEADLVLLHRMLTDGTCDLLLTTEKDAVKLPRDGFARGSCAVVEISVAVAEREDIFWGKIAEVLAC
jgi:tetraacyldisaccharide 4'-kinase